MAEDNPHIANKDQNVVVMNSVLPIEAVKPIPISIPDPLNITGVVNAKLVPESRNYEYKVFRSQNNYFGFLRPEDANQDVESLTRWLNEGWEIHYDGSPNPFIPYSPGNPKENVFILRRPK